MLPPLATVTTYKHNQTPRQDMLLNLLHKDRTALITVMLIIITFIHLYCTDKLGMTLNALLIASVIPVNAWLFNNAVHFTVSVSVLIPAATV